MFRGRPAALAFGLAVACAPLAAACGTDAVGVDACKQIEQARCRQAPACQISLEPPYHQAGDDVDACIRYYDVACLHGLAAGKDPGSAAVSACVQAIQNNGCSVVSAPESDPSCAFLIPQAPPSLPADAGASDATTDVGEAASGD
jgi:hypothetical protein